MTSTRSLSLTGSVPAMIAFEISGVSLAHGWEETRWVVVELSSGTEPESGSDRVELTLEISPITKNTQRINGYVEYDRMSRRRSRTVEAFEVDRPGRYREWWY